MALVDVGRVAAALNLSPARCQQLAKVGMPREGRGQYDVVRCMLWYVRYLQKALERRNGSLLDGGFVGAGAPRVRLLRAKADLREIEVARERAQLVSLEDVEATLSDLVVRTRAHVMAIPARVAPEILGVASRIMIQALIEKACRTALSNLANTPAVVSP